MRTLLLLGLGTAGAAGAIYFLDQKRGPKRRKQFMKQFHHTMDTAEDVMHEYSKRLGPKAQEFSRLVGERASQYGERAAHYGNEAKTRAADYWKNGNGWTPSARLVGAMGSALAFYGAGRKGMTGTILRTISLGLFTRALMSGH